MGATASAPQQLEEFRSVAAMYDANKGKVSDTEMLNLLKGKLSGVPDNLFSTVDYDAAKRDLLKVMDDPEWDDGTYAPLLIRLAWHSSGTFDKNTGKGTRSSMNYML
jgi:catalase (peroxidase I)